MEGIVSKRRLEKKSVKYLGIDSKQIIYLNDYSIVNDQKLYKAKNKIINFLNKLINKKIFKKIISLACERGNPNHDFLSLIVYGYSKKQNKSIIFPAYNYEIFFFFLYKVLNSLSNQTKIYRKIYLGKLCLIDSIIVASIYKSEI